MKKNPVRHKLKRGETSLGTWLTLPDPVAARLMAATGMDWLTVEMEHSAVTWEVAAQSIISITTENCVPLVRVPWNTGENIKRALDNGAWGVVVPMVNSRREAEAVVAACRYAPAGHRSVGGHLHAAGFGTDPATYYARANEEILVAIMIEHVDAVEAIDEILSVPGVDVAFIGPNDLHHSMGKAPVFDSDDPAFTAAVARVLESARSHGVAPGMHVVDAEAALRRMAQGFQFLALASETGFMVSKARETLAQLNADDSGRTVAKY